MASEYKKQGTLMGVPCFLVLALMTRSSTLTLPDGFVEQNGR